MDTVKDIALTAAIVVSIVMLMLISIGIPICTIQYFDEKVLCAQAQQELNPVVMGSIFNKKCYIIINGLPYQYDKLHHMQLN